MGKSKKVKKHFMDGSSFEMNKKVRKPMPKPSKAMSTRTETRKKRWKWQDEIDED